MGSKIFEPRKRNSTLTCPNTPRRLEIQISVESQIFRRVHSGSVFHLIRFVVRRFFVWVSDLEQKIIPERDPPTSVEKERIERESNSLLSLFGDVLFSTKRHLFKLENQTRSESHRLKTLFEIVYRSEVRSGNPEKRKFRVFYNEIFSFDCVVFNEKQ